MIAVKRMVTFSTLLFAFSVRSNKEIISKGSNSIHCIVWFQYFTDDVETFNHWRLTTTIQDIFKVSTQMIKQRNKISYKCILFGVTQKQIKRNRVINKKIGKITLFPHFKTGYWNNANI